MPTRAILDRKAPKTLPSSLRSWLREFRPREEYLAAELTHLILVARSRWWIAATKLRKDCRHTEGWAPNFLGVLRACVRLHDPFESLSDWELDRKALSDLDSSILRQARQKTSKRSWGYPQSHSWSTSYYRAIVPQADNLLWFSFQRCANWLRC